MFMRSRKLAAIVAYLSAWMLAPRANADILDLIFDRAQAAKDRAGEARDRAREAGETARDIRDRIQRAVDNLSEDAIASILEAGQQIRDEIASAKAEYDEFVSGAGCEDCRARLIAGLTNLQTLLDQYLAELLPPCVGSVLDGRDVDLQPLIALLERGDCKILFPVCTALGASLCILEDLQDAVQALQTIRDVVGSLNDLLGEDAASDPVEIVPSLEASDPFLAQYAERVAKRVSGFKKYLVHHDDLADASKKLKGKAKELKALAALMEIKEKPKQATIGLHGYLLIEVDFNKAKQLRQILGVMESGFNQIATLIDAKLKEADTASAQYLVLSNQFFISRQIAQAQAATNGSSTASIKNGRSQALGLEPLGCGGVGLLPLTLTVGCVALLRWTWGPRHRTSSAGPQGSQSERL